MERFLKINKSDILNIHKLKKELTIPNPNYLYQLKEIGIPENKITVPKEFPIYTETDDEIIIPRAAADDPKVATWINLWSTPEKPRAKFAKVPLWKPGMKLRDYQNKPCSAILDNYADIIIAECGSGKTVMGTYILSHVKMPVCIVVHTDFLADQWRSEIENFTTVETIRTHKNDLLGRKRTKSMSLRYDIVIAKVQALANMPYGGDPLFDEFYDRFNLVIFDEVHTMGSMEFHKVISNFKCKRMGLTATPNRTDGFRTYMWCIGNRKVVADGKQDVEPAIIGMDTGIGPDIEPAEFHMYTARGDTANLPKLINHIYSFDVRFEATVFLTKELLKMGRHVMLLSHRREYAQRLFDAIDFKDKEILMGGTKKVSQEHKQLVVATFQLMRIAFNRPRLDVLINTGPYGAFNDVKQSTGRIIRAHDDKPTPIVIDMYENDEDMSYGLFRKRCRAYEQMNYPITYTMGIKQTLAEVEKIQGDNNG